MQYRRSVTELGMGISGRRLVEELTLSFRSARAARLVLVMEDKIVRN